MITIKSNTYNKKSNPELFEVRFRLTNYNNEIKREYFKNKPEAQEFFNKVKKEAEASNATGSIALWNGGWLCYSVKLD